MHPAAEQYRDLLLTVDRWFEEVSARHPGVIPCRSGCSACCHGPFDISSADALLLREGLATLTPVERALVRDRGTQVLARLRDFAPGWGPPHVLGREDDDWFDRAAEALADEPCPLLDEAGACRLYAYRPLVCRLIGLPMMTAEGELLENACPIQEQFPDYAVLSPQLFDLGALDQVETELLTPAAVALRGDPSAVGFETTIAALAAEA